MIIIVFNCSVLYLQTIHKSSVCSKYYRTIMPLSCPYMVNLHKFYETENAVYLVLQHATGGKLWNYIGEYLQINKSNSSINVDNIPTSSTNVYSGFNVYANATKEVVERCQNTQDQSQDDICDEVGHTSNQNNFEDNKLPDTVSDISDISDDKIDNGVSDKPDYNRFESLSSEENPDLNDNLDLSEQREDVFQELLFNSHRTTLENFSINSIDSNDSRPRIDSFISDNIESIPEENEHNQHMYDPPTTVNSHNDILNGLNTNTENHSDFVVDVEKKNSDSSCDINKQINDQQHSDSENSLVDQEADAIVQNAKDLLKTVERTLSQTDSEVNKCIHPDTVRDHVQNKTLISKKKDELNDSCDTITDHEELSIYDIDRSSSDTNSDNDSKQCKSHDLNSKNRNNTVQYSSSETISDKTGSLKMSRSSTLTDQTRSKPQKLSRMNSKELSRSFENELKSPHLTRQRTLSDVFKQLDLAMSSPDQVKIPETCIRQWIAEIIIAVSRLHAEGLVCRLVS